MKFPYEELRYLKARGPDDKRPAEAWGGYGQDLNEAECVYTAEEVADSAHAHWLTNSLVDKQMKRKLLIFDLDIHKAPEDFDPDRVTVDANTPLVRSQNGGIHVYTAIVDAYRTAKESDFVVDSRCPFDIDIRGEFVKHHVVAPNAIPGVGGSYELVNDETIRKFFHAREACSLIKLDGEDVLSFKPATSSHSGGIGYEREEIDPPEDMPTCYAAGLSLRAEAPEDPNLNTHKVNVLTALSGLASGYSVDTVVSHFIDEYYPGNAANADRQRTEYHVEHIAEKLDGGEYSPPAVRTLQEYGILPPDEPCQCGLPGHDIAAKNRSAYYDVDLEEIARGQGFRESPYDSDQAMLRACLHARENNPDLADEKPPYAAIRAVAEMTGLPFGDPEEDILGKSTYMIARRIFNDLESEDINEAGASLPA